MYFLLSLLTSGILGYFMPQWMYQVSWPDLIELTNPETTSNKVNIFLKEIGLADKTVAELATERLITVCAITVAIFIAMLIITKIIKKATNKNK